MKIKRIPYIVNTTLMLQSVHPGSVLLPDSTMTATYCRELEVHYGQQPIYIVTSDPDADAEANQATGLAVIERLKSLKSHGVPPVAVISEDSPPMIFTATFKQTLLYKEIEAAQAREQEYRSKLARHQELVDKEFLARYVPRHAGTFTKPDHMEQLETAQWLNEYERHYHNGVPFSKNT